MSKLKKVGYYDLETGEELTRETIESLEKEDYKRECYMVKNKMENYPYEMTKDELLLYKKITRSRGVPKLQYEKGTFFTAIKIEDADMTKLSLDTFGVLWLISGLCNVNGVLIHSGNHRPITSFEKLRVKLNIGSTKWTKVKKDIDEYSLIVKSYNRKNRSILVVNPFYSYVSNKIGESRFIAFGDIIKDKIPLVDYLLLCKEYDIVPEFIT